MAKKYVVLHQRSGLQVVTCEIPVTDENIIGFVDAVMSDDKGYWWIVDLKTAARLNKSLQQRLANDPQLNLYSYYAPDIAEELGLDIDKFKGIRYRVTTKTNTKIRSNETVDEYALRVYNAIEAYDIAIEVGLLYPKHAYNQLMEIYEGVEIMQFMIEVEIQQNFNYCEEYFRPCAYWSRCHGKVYSEAGAGIPLWDSETIPNLNEYREFETVDDFSFDDDIFDF
jgi:hypothetical protein